LICIEAEETRRDCHPPALSATGGKVPRVPSLGGGLASYSRVDVEVLSEEAITAASEELGGWRGEAMTQLSLALPVSLSMVCNRVMSLTSVSFVGHLGPLPLAGAALATTLGNVTGNSIMVGMAGAVSTLGGQAFGAKSYPILGQVLQRALIILTIAAVPIAVAWGFAESALLALGQDPGIAHASGLYIRALIPGLFFYAWNICVQAYLQSQRITRPGAVAGVVAAALHVPANLLFMRGFGWGFVGAGLATSWSNGVVLAINVSYLCFHPSRRRLSHTAERTWEGWDLKAATSEWGPFLRLAIPGILMMAEWWASEANIIIAGWLPDPEYNVAGVSIFQVTNALAFMVPVGFSVAVLTRSSNELGAGRAAHARHAGKVAFGLILVVEAVISTVILFVRYHWARLYTDDDRIVRLVSRLLVPLAVYTAFDGVLCVATGLIKACGRQWVAGPVVILAYYVVGIPLACALSFGAGIGAMGLAIGATVGTVIHSVIICVLVARTDWRGEVRRCAERLHKGGGGGNKGGGAASAGGRGDEEAAAPEALLPAVAELELEDRGIKAKTAGPAVIEHDIDEI
jgi:MATE family multidrug resistance protein